MRPPACTEPPVPAPCRGPGLYPDRRRGTDPVPPSLDRGAREALDRGGGGTTVSDVVIRDELRYIPFVHGLGCYVIEGDAS